MYVLKRFYNTHNIVYFGFLQAFRKTAVIRYEHNIT